LNFNEKSGQDMAIKSVDYSGFMFGTVVNNIDPKNEGRVQVLIKRLQMSSSLDDATESTELEISNSFIRNKTTETKSTMYSSNFIWLRPLCFMENNNEHNVGGYFRIPKIKQHILAIFVDEDPQKGYYFPLTPSIKGDTFSTINSSCDMSNPNLAVNNHTIGLYDNGTRVEIDNNDDTNSFNIVVDNYSDGKEVCKLNIENNTDNKKIKFSTPKDTTVLIDNSNDEENITLKTSTGNEIKIDKDKVSITCNGNLDINAKGNITIKGSNIYLN
jgi:hypothetical protein